eukprot:TRINITY_DN247_c8_g1_i1.p1 TRINITY_DN247_c8_g1~~TRINITY_DN247_c8_g1_i1.p1  ORF type:complete len:133 (+),score=32.36 TRINITY_DN247_c8_g1_i1:109-507(+)
MDQFKKKSTTVEFLLDRPLIILGLTVTVGALVKGVFTPIENQVLTQRLMNIRVYGQIFTICSMLYYGNSAVKNTFRKLKSYSPDLEFILYTTALSAWRKENPTMRFKRNFDITTKQRIEADKVVPLNLDNIQ